MTHKEFFKLEITKPYIYGLILSTSVFFAYIYTTTSIDAIKTKTDLETRVLELQRNLAKNQYDNDILKSILETKNNDLNKIRNQNNSLEDEIDEKKKSIEKLKETDKELLQKYSKVFFLNENYTPRELTPIDSKYISTKGKKIQIHADVWPFLENLLKAADDNAGLDLRITSGYRSFAEQSSLKSTYKVIYGAGTANSFSADQGYSEHQLGTTIDFTTSKLVGAVDAFANTPENQWLLDNAYKYGFILSYPKNNKYYIYEPWHWRFVGKELAGYLHDNKMNFYDMDQRDIDDYQENIWQN